jgi:hypothetical protein
VVPFVKEIEEELQWFEDNDGNVKPGFETNPVYGALRPTLDSLLAQFERLEDAQPVHATAAAAEPEPAPSKSAPMRVALPVAKKRK